MTVHRNLGMPHRMCSKPHTITEDELMAYVRRERWDVFASSSREPKALEVSMIGSGFRVTVGDTEVYRGQNASDAVRSYNEATKPVQ